MPGFSFRKASVKRFGVKFVSAKAAFEVDIVFSRLAVFGQGRIFLTGKSRKRGAVMKSLWARILPAAGVGTDAVYYFKN